MTIEQQRTAAIAYRQHVRELGQQAFMRNQNLNAELFLTEGQDAAWGTVMDAKVRASLATEKAFEGSMLESFECRVTVCRAVLRFPDDDPQQMVRNGRQPWSVWHGQFEPVRSEMGDGVPGFRATVYLGEDFDLPRRRGPRAGPGPGGP
jgi:hypothetical protein